MTLENSINSLKHLLLLLLFYSLISCGFYSKEFSGSTFGTYYKIKYFSDEKVYVDQKEIDSVFTIFNNSLSTYLIDSKISK
jgi:thiamine biosynthesis lipoprotein